MDVLEMVLALVGMRADPAQTKVEVAGVSEVFFFQRLKYS